MTILSVINPAIEPYRKGSTVMITKQGTNHTVTVNNHDGYVMSNPFGTDDLGNFYHVMVDREKFPDITITFRDGKGDIVRIDDLELKDTYYQIPGSSYA